LDLLVGLGGDLGREGAAAQGEGGDEHDGDERGFLHPVSLESIRSQIMEMRVQRRGS
jgi:hypothetical protein